MENTKNIPEPKNIIVARLMNDTAKLIRTDFERRAKRQCGAGGCTMTRSQFAALIAVKHRQGCTQAELASELDLEPISVTKLLERMGNLIERREDPGDRRLKRLYLTEAAWEGLRRARPIAEETMEKAIQGLTQQELEFAIRVISRIRDNVSAELRQMEEIDHGKRTKRHS